MELNRELIEKLSYRGVLAYVATQMLGGGNWTTARLAQAVSCNSSLMREGMQELHDADPLRVAKQRDKKWPIAGELLEEQVQILDSAEGRRADFIDDLKRYWDHRNPDVKFTMGVSDGRQIAVWLKQHKDWDQAMWRNALNNRAKSEVNHASPIYLWVAKLEIFSQAPLDKYGVPMLNGGGKHGEIATTRQRNREAVERAIANA